MGLGLLVFETGDAAASAALVTSDWFCGALLVAVVSLCSLFDLWIEKKVASHFDQVDLMLCSKELESMFNFLG